MKFNFKIQDYQTDAVESIVKVFEGQGYHSGLGYIRDLGSLEAQPKNQQMSFLDDEFGEQIELEDTTGYKNEEIVLTDERLLQNIRDLQMLNNIKQLPSLVKDLGRCSLDIEMETGTGKTYVYIKTMFELNKR